MKTGRNPGNVSWKMSPSSRRTISSSGRMPEKPLRSALSAASPWRGPSSLTVGTERFTGAEVVICPVYAVGHLAKMMSKFTLDWYVCGADQRCSGSTKPASGAR